TGPHLAEDCVQWPRIRKQPNGPGTHMLVRVREQGLQRVRIGQAQRVQGPETTEPDGDVLRRIELLPQASRDLVDPLSGYVAVGQLTAGLTNKPLIPMGVQCDQFLSGEPTEVRRGSRFVDAVTNSEDAS